MHLPHVDSSRFGCNDPKQCGKNQPRCTNRSIDTHSKRLFSKLGFGTLEVVIIIAVLLSVALIFRSALTDYANNLIQTVLGNDTVIEDLEIND